VLWLVIRDHEPLGTFKQIMDAQRFIQSQQIRDDTFHLNHVEYRIDAIQDGELPGLETMPIEPIRVKSAWQWLLGEDPFEDAGD
jgi:hypothetical protein